MESDTNSGCAIPSVYANRCPLILALDMIGGKWKLPIVWYLSKSETLRQPRRIYPQCWLMWQENSSENTIHYICMAFSCLKRPSSFAAAKI